MPNLFRDYHAAALEAEYVPSSWPGFPLSEIIQKWVAMGEAYRGRARVTADVPYGPGDRQRLDLFQPKNADAPLLIFIHGGYWRNRILDKTACCFCIEPIVNAGALVAMIEYALCPDVSLETIVAQVRDACVWLWRNVRRYGGDPDQLHISGHSAGGHLAALMAATDWPEFQHGLPADMVKSIIPVSGLFELEPLRLSSLNVDLRLDLETARRNSPRYLLPTSRLPVSVVVGGSETDEFRRQSREFAEAWKSAAGSVEYLETPGHNHFTVIEAMTEPGNPLTATIIRHLGLRL